MVKPCQIANPWADHLWISLPRFWCVDSHDECVLPVFPMLEIKKKANKCIPLVLKVKNRQFIISTRMVLSPSYFCLISKHAATTEFVHSLFNQNNQPLLFEQNFGIRGITLLFVTLCVSCMVMDCAVTKCFFILVGINKVLFLWDFPVRFICYTTLETIYCAYCISY